MKQSLLFRFFACLSICFLNEGAAFAQTTFQRTYARAASNDGAISIIPLADGYMISGAARANSTGSWDGSLIKTDYDGHILWQKTYGYVGGGLDDFYHVTQTNDGDFLVVGAANGFENGPTDLIMVKTDADGNPLWQKRVSGSSSNFSEWGHYILPVSGGYVISGIAVTKTGFFTNDRGLMLRIDHAGDVIWSRLYSSGTSNTRYLNARYISGDTLFACGQRDSAGMFARIDATTGNLIAMQSYEGAGFANDAFQSMVQTPNGDFLLAGDSQDSSGRRQWVCRVSRSGELKWSKIYSGIGQGAITSLSDGHFLLTTTPADVGGNFFDPILVKIDGNGNVLWSEKYGKPGIDVFSAALETPDGGIIAVGSTKPVDNNNTGRVTLVVKTDKNGGVSGCCRQTIDVTAMPYQVTSFPSDFIQSPFFNPQDFSLTAETNTLTAQDFCPPGPPEEILKEVFLCPGDSVSIDGIFYSAPATVTDTIPGTPCDTLVIYTIQYTDLGGASAIDIQCPANRVVQLAAGTNSAVINFDAPSAQSDCPCPGVELVQTQGLPGGSNFAVGVHDICFQGQDSCGNSSECCFQISVVEEEDACDVKTNGCMTFELLRVTRDADWRRTYHIRVTNNCTQSLVYAAFQLPDGIVADAPANNATYIAPSGRQYVVRNPNFSPFYSVRYTAQGTGIQNGDSDVIRYTLPPQSAPDYIHVMARTGTQTYTAAHLNTFNCPVELEPASPRPAEARSSAAQSDDIALFPSPTTGVLFADLKSFSGAIALIRIFSAQGNPVFSRQVEIEDQILRVDLPAGMASGLYLFEIMDDRGGKHRKRFVVH